MPASEAGLAVGPPPGSRLGANEFFVSWKNIFFSFLLLKSHYFRDHLQRKKLENNNVYVHLAETAADVQRPANPQRPVQGSTAPRGPEATIRNIESGN